VNRLGDVHATVQPVLRRGISADPTRRAPLRGGASYLAGDQATAESLIGEDFVPGQTGERYRNAELLTVRDGRIAEAQVFFGGKVAD
jgi:hypothetical protein